MTVRPPPHRSQPQLIETSMSITRVFVDDVLVSPPSGTKWEQQTDEKNSYAGTLSICHAGSTSATDFSLPPPFTLLFSGTDVFMYGTLTEGLAVNYSIDSGPSRSMIFSTKTTGKPGVELWSLTGLVSGVTSSHHTLDIMPIAGDLIIDYFTYTPPSSGDLEGSELIFDDQHPALEYSKGWVVASSVEYPQGTPYLHTATGTNTVGSSMELQFNGESVAVYGILQQVPGILSVTFSVDNAEPTVYTPWNGTQTNSSVWSVASQMYQSSVSPGSHTLRVSLKQATGSQMLWLDSVITEATFGTTLSNAVGGSGSGSSTGTTATGGATPTLGTTPTNTQSSSGISGGAIWGIAGGTSGFLLLLGIVLKLSFLRLWLRRIVSPSPEPPLQPEVTQVLLVPAPVPPTPPQPIDTPPVTGILKHLFAQHRGTQMAPPEKTHWDVQDDVSSRSTGPSHQGSASNLLSHQGQWV